MANAVLSGLDHGGYRGLSCYTEVIQDGMLHLIKEGIVTHASTTALALTGRRIPRSRSQHRLYHDRIILRPQEISNHPEVVRRLGIIAMNGMLEADIYGNVNSTHVMGTKIMNGIGGSGDFARNGFVSMFLSPSTARGGRSPQLCRWCRTSTTEHDVQVIVTEYGLADLRSLSPRKRARVIIDKCAHPDYRPALDDYFLRAQAATGSGQTPHLLGETFAFHQRYLATGSMK